MPRRQFLHHVYWTTLETFAPRNVEYLAAMSSAIFDLNENANADERLYGFLKDMLTPVNELNLSPSGIADAYAYESLGLSNNATWDNFTSSDYDPLIQPILAAGANRTFGSTEFNNLSDASQTQLITAKNNSTGGWTAYFGEEDEYDDEENLNITTGISGAPNGVFLMTPTDFNTAQGLSKR